MKQTHLIITALLFITSTVIPQSKVNINNLSDYGGKMFKENDDKPYTGLVFDLYRTTGNKSLEGRYKDGLRNGKWSWWNVDNKMDSSGTYKDGNLNGKWTYWNENGQKRSEKKYKDGVPDGKWTEWSGGEAGAYVIPLPYHKSFEGTYKKGELIEGTYWDENGNVIEDEY
jgi:antitoxin component YwqK of YwqJK toxin-antitoxin module